MSTRGKLPPFSPRLSPPHTGCQADSAGRPSHTSCDWRWSPHTDSVRRSPSPPTLLRPPGNEAPFPPWKRARTSRPSPRPQLASLHPLPPPPSSRWTAPVWSPVAPCSVTGWREQIWGPEHGCPPSPPHFGCWDCSATQTWMIKTWMKNWEQVDNPVSFTSTL